MTRLALLLPLALLAGCKDDAPKSVSPPTPAAKAEPAPSGGGGNTNYVAGGGAVQNSRQAAKRADLTNDLANLGTFMTDQEITLGKMPSAAEVTAALKADPNFRKVSELVAAGTIMLTGTTSRSGLWAYEIEADSKGGLGLVAGRANRYTADEIKNLKQGG